MNTTLVIMAAGLGSRYSKHEIKQLAMVGPNNEIIMDYSIYDAKRAGFNKVVFIIRKDIKEAFDQAIGSHIQDFIDVEYVYQELECLPEGYHCPSGRVKPFGTGQAVLMCKDIVKEPFVVINADDYYGIEAFKKIHDYLVNQKGYCMAGFVLKNTLSDHGSVSRGICEVKDGYLQNVVETTHIEKTSTGAKSDEEELNINSIVSMNMWGADPSLFDELEKEFKNFLDHMEDPLKSEFYLPSLMDHLIKEKNQKIAVLETKDQWFGVTYEADKAVVMENFQRLTDAGIYPKKLF